MTERHTMSESNTLTDSFQTKIKLLAEFVGMPNKTPEQEKFLRFHGGGCYLAYHLYNGYFSSIEKGFLDIDSAWENLLFIILGEDVWDEHGNLLPKFLNVHADSLSEL